MASFKNGDVRLGSGKGVDFNGTKQTGAGYTKSEADAAFLGINDQADDSVLLNGQAGSYYTNADNLSSGVISIDRLPAAALERLVEAADETARFALLVANVQNGDTVKQLDTGDMYRVIDDTNLDSAAGYTIYTAGTAAAVPWAGITGKPTTFTPASHGNESHSGTYIEAAGVTYENLNTNGDVGVASGTLVDGGVYTTGLAGKENTFSKNTAFNKNFGTASGDVCQGNDSRLSDNRDPNSHGNESHSGTYIEASGVTYENLNTNGDVGTGSAQVAAGDHAHAIGDITGVTVSQSGVTAIADATTTIVIVFATEGKDNMANASYSINWALENLTDGTPGQYPGTITAKATTGFSVQLSGPTDSANYSIDWSVRA